MVNENNLKGDFLSYINILLYCEKFYDQIKKTTITVNVISNKIN